MQSQNGNLCFLKKVKKNLLSGFTFFYRVFFITFTELSLESLTPAIVDFDLMIILRTMRYPAWLKTTTSLHGENFTNSDPKVEIGEIANFMNLKESSHLCPDCMIHLRVEFFIKTDEESVNDQTKGIGSSVTSLIDVNTKNPFDNTFNALTAADADSVLLKTHDGMTLKACKQILGAHSSVFESMFEIDMQEASKKAVEIIDFSGSVMQELLRFIYSGEVRGIENIEVELYEAAKVYEIAELPELCLKSIVRSLTVANVFEIVVFADLHGVDDLFNECCEIIRT